MNATTTVLPLYWLSLIDLPGARLMTNSGAGRGRLAAWTIGAVKKSSARAVAGRPGLRMTFSVPQGLDPTAGPTARPLSEPSAGHGRMNEADVYANHGESSRFPLPEE